MISKPLPAHSFYHTCRYICNKSGAEVLIAEGVRGHDFKVMAEDFLGQQQMRPGKEKACFHSILSFYPGEKPSDEMMKEIAQKYLERLEIVNTQFSVSKHTDKDHIHLHIVANMVDNDGKAITDSWIGLRGKKIAQQLTEEYKLIPALKKNLNLIHMEALSESEAYKYKIYDAIIRSLPHCRTMEDLEAKLLKLGIETKYKYKGQTQEKQGVSFKIGNICFKGSQVDRAFSLAGLEKSFVEKRKLAEEMQQKTRQNPEQRYTAPRQKPSQTTKLSIPISNEDPSSSKTNDPVEVFGKIIDALLKPSENQGGGYGLSDEEKRRRKKKKRRRPRL